jgi:hypothetical protein
LGCILLSSYLFQTHRPVHKKIRHSKPSHLLQRWVISLVQNSEPCLETVHLKHFMLLSSPLNHINRITINVDTCVTRQAFLPLFSLTQHSKLQKSFCAESQLAAWFRDLPTSIEVGKLASTWLKAPTADCIPTSYC